MTAELIANQPSGLRGWLGLMGVGMVLSPVRALVDWAALAKDKDLIAGWESGVPLARNIVLGSHGISAAALAGSVWLAFLFFDKDRRFPWHFTVFQAGSVAVLTVFAAWITAATGTNVFPEMVREAAPQVVAAGLWIAYLHNSKRVANTFVK